MKNIHLIPSTPNDETAKGIWIKETRDWCNIYITSDEEIKEGDWTLMFDDFGHLFLCDKPQQYLGIEKGHHLNKGLRKIILTTDGDLIKDGVQSIDDEFLQWFVNNPSCEKVEIEYQTIGLKNGVWQYDYKIVIHKEEPKQETLKEVKPKDIQRIIASTNAQTASIEILQLFTQLQNERMYSEEEVMDLFRKYQYDLAQWVLRMEDDIGGKPIPTEWFEQFKKK